jgi:hypothetical protein
MYVTSSGHCSVTTWQLQGSGRASEGDAGNACNDDAVGAASAPADGAGQGKVSDSKVSNGKVSNGAGVSIGQY